MVYYVGEADVSFRIRGSGCISVWAFYVGDFDY